MEFFTTKYINLIIKEKYLKFIDKYYIDILGNPNKYISLVEDKIVNYLGGGYVRLVNSGTTALQFGLLSLGVHPGDEIILPANTYAATAIVITNIGAIPIFCDINLNNFTLCPKDLKRKITTKTKVIIPVHLYGYNCNMDDILDISKKNNISILEDASHAFGGEYKGKKLGTLGDIGVFSCHNSKNFGTFGNGGIFYTKHKKLFDKITNYIYPDNNTKDVLLSGRTPANIGLFDAISLLFKLDIIDSIIDSNLELYKLYLKKYKSYGFIFPDLDLDKNRLHIRNFTVLSYKRDELLKNNFCKQYYSINLAQSKTFKSFTKNKTLKNTEIFFSKNLSLPFYYGIEK